MNKSVEYGNSSRLKLKIWSSIAKERRLLERHDDYNLDVLAIVMVSEHFGIQKLLELCCKGHEWMLVLDVSDSLYEAPNLHTQAKGSWYAHSEETQLAPYCVCYILAVALLGKCCHSAGP